MKLDLKKSNTIITNAFHSRYSLLKLSSKALLPSYASSKEENEDDAIRIQLWQATHLSTKNLMNELAMNNRSLLVTAVFHLVHPVEKDS